jgi:hypothetical protein
MLVIMSLSCMPSKAIVLLIADWIQISAPLRTAGSRSSNEAPRGGGPGGAMSLDRLAKFIPP